MSSLRLRDDIQELTLLFSEKGLRKAYVKTYGCQQNVNDSEKIKGILKDAGCTLEDSAEGADIIVLNTCAVRENAEDRVFGHVGALKKLCEQKQEKLLMLGGCMVQQKHIADRLRESYPFVDVLFSTNALERLPGLILQNLKSRARVFEPYAENFDIDENIPVYRDGGYRALVPVMYGCDNYCSYCVVPFVRGKERSRRSGDIIEEFRRLVDGGYKDIMLLGQNVNSYGKNLKENINFSKLLRMLNDQKGDFVIRFMTSHPKDATQELFETIADCEKISRNIHLPVQSGSDRILERMNRGYTGEGYLRLLEQARELIDGVSFTSDIIIGFPKETKEDFSDTVELVKRAGFYSLFTFIYSKREGTKAALMSDDTPHRVKADRLIELTGIQDLISKQQDSLFIGKLLRGIVAKKIDDETCEVRLDNNSVVVAKGGAAPGAFCGVEVTGLVKGRLHGVIA